MASADQSESRCDFGFNNGVHRSFHTVSPDSEQLFTVQLHVLESVSDYLPVSSSSRNLSPVRGTGEGDAQTPRNTDRSALNRWKWQGQVSRGRAPVVGSRARPARTPLVIRMIVDAGRSAGRITGGAGRTAGHTPCS